MSAATKRRYWRLREKGLCVDCGKHKVLEHKVRCPGCHEGQLVEAELRRGHIDETPDPDEKPPAILERCRCGLLLPCESCLPPIHFYATSRPGPREAGLYTMKHPRGQ